MQLQRYVVNLRFTCIKLHNEGAITEVQAGIFIQESGQCIMLLLVFVLTNP